MPKQLALAAISWIWWKRKGKYRALSLTKLLVYSIIHCQVPRAVSHPNLAHLEGFSFQRRFSPHLSPSTHSLRGADPLSAVIPSQSSHWSQPGSVSDEICAFLYFHSLLFPPSQPFTDMSWLKSTPAVWGISILTAEDLCSTGGALDSWTHEVTRPRQKAGEDLHQRCSRPTLSVQPSLSVDPKSNSSLSRWKSEEGQLARWPAGLWRYFCTAQPGYCCLYLQTRAKILLLCILLLQAVGSCCSLVPAPQWAKSGWALMGETSWGAGRTQSSTRPSVIEEDKSKRKRQLLLFMKDP